MLRFTLAIVALCGLASTSWSHPGNGILAMPDGSVVTGDAVGNGIWRFVEGSRPQLIVRNFHCHWLTRGQNGKLYADRQFAEGGAWKVSHYQFQVGWADPIKLRTSPDMGAACFTVDANSTPVFWQQDRLVQVRGDGAPAPYMGNGKPASGQPKVDGVSSIVWGPNGSLFLCDGPHIRKVDSRGEISIVATFTGRPSVDMYGAAGGKQRIWGLAVDERGRMFAAVASLAQVIQVDPDGKQHVVAHSENGWIATGVAVRAGSIYLLETKLVGNRNLGPRVRRVDPTGKITVLGEAKR